MECNKKSCPTTGTYIGIHDINFRETNSLNERFSNSGRREVSSNSGYRMSIEEKIHQNISVHLGTNHFESDLLEAIKKVMKRDWPQLDIGKFLTQKHRIVQKDGGAQ